MADKFYITTPLYYVNAPPHIGHSYTNIAADCLARYMRKILGKENVWFLTGTDEHGQKIQKAAQEAGFSPQEFADKMVVEFQELWRKLDISYDDFIRTTESRHIKTVSRALEILYAAGDIYQDVYEGWYCTPCETFLSNAQVNAEVCPDCKRAIEKISETNYFFKLSRYQDWLIGHIETHPDFIQPLMRKNEVLSFLRLNKLNDLCISRPKERLLWGIPLPFSAGHVTYVWFDALINYISAVGEFDAKGAYHSRWWPADLHLIGKDILRQHAVYWPIILRALNIASPEVIFAHGWWMIEQSKMSKSRGKVVSTEEMTEKFGRDAYRYFLLRDVPYGLDGNFSEEAIIKRLNSDLANDLGNLVYRTLNMAEIYFQGNIPEVDIPDKDAKVKEIKIKINSLDGEVKKSLSLTGGNFNFASALESIWQLINCANKYVEEAKPWNLARENKTEELKIFIRLLVEVIRKTAESISPFMPQTSASILDEAGGKKVNKAGPLFPRREIS